LPELVYIAERATGGRVVIRDAGLLEAAAARPRATAFGADAYPDLDTKAAALLHSLARNHALVDGNKRLALGALIAFYGVNGRQLSLTNDAAYDLVMQVAVGQLDSVDDIAAILVAGTRPRR
jgi:death-on-curing protein